MLVMIYLNTNKQSFDVGKLGVAGSGADDGILVSNILAARVLKFAVETPIVMVSQFPPPSYLIEDSDLNEQS